MIGFNMDVGSLVRNAVSGIAGSAGGAAGSAGGILSALDPLGGLVSSVASSLGLPPEVANVAKVVIGTCTGNPIMAASGGLGLIQDVAKELPAVTEHFQGHLSGGMDGYGNGYLSGEFSGKYGNAFFDAGLPALNPYLQGSLLLGRMGFPQVDLHGSFSVGPLAIGIGGCCAQRDAQRSTKGPPPPPGSSLIDRPSPPPGRAVHHNPGSPLDPNILEYRDAVATLQANHATFDTAHGTRDGGITREDLLVIARNPNASDTLRQAAQFLLDHPEYFNRLEMAAGLGTKDGIVGKLDLKAELARVDEQIAYYGVPSANGTKPALGPQAPTRGGVTDDSSGIQDILNDPTLSVEEKIMFILQKVTDSLDEELIAATQDLDKARQDRAKEAGKGGDKVDQEKLAKLDSAMEKTQLRLQGLMEKRKRMFELMSNMSSKFHEMARSAIQNMARA